MLRLFAASSLGVLLLFSNAYALKVSVGGGLNLAHPKIGPENSTIGDYAASIVTKLNDVDPLASAVLGASAEFDLPSKFGLEVGAFYQVQQHRAEYTKSNYVDNEPYGTPVAIEVESTTKWLSIPVLARYHVIKDYFNVGLGGYWARGIGDYKTSTTTDGVTTSLSQSYEKQMVHRSDYGLTISVVGSYPVGETFMITGDVRYQYGLRNLSTNPNNDSELSTRNCLALLGLSRSF